MDPILEIRHLSKAFGGIKAVNDVSFCLGKGELLGLIGPNGSGKSTCVNLISGAYIPDSGQVLFCGKDIQGSNICQRARMGIGRTFQTPKPFNGLTVYDSVYTVALQSCAYKEAADKTEEILEMMELADLSRMFCEKLPIEKRKWLDMARILANDPKVIMLDEVMAGLNPAEMEESIRLVRKLNESGISIIFIEHVMKAVIKLSHRLVVLNEGKLLCGGDPEEVMRNESVIKAYLGGGRHRA
ncbi:ABC transporter ATP-binding protein [Lacrimispora sp. NSJ-141]|uniref:ABC transporter ATP-binding protein n=1 Tax=Lientehia hominis TaxID=2897778 RepID=A0AAP2RL44_9FIRM|nr:ABC transporter ATP-binding protein [Lientehia hominis]MCD2492975.1 ABC transporter ATP-binding protein [Lientehia hominis]